MNTTSPNICLFVNSLACGGAEKVVVTLAPQFSSMGLNVEILSLERDNFHLPGDESIKYLSENLAGKGRLAGKTIELLPLALRLKQYVKNNNIKLVQSHIYRANYINVLSRMLGSKHKAQIVNHGMPSQYKKEGFKGLVNRFLVRWLYPKADQVICPSKGMIDELHELAVSNRKLLLIHNPVDIDLIMSLGREKISPALFQFDPKNKYIIAIGRFSSVKRTADIVDAFAILAARDSKLRLILLGDGNERINLQAQVNRLKLGGKVHMPGFVINPYQYLARSDVFVSASETEGFSVVIVDALALGIPVVSTDCKSGPREILAPDSNLDLKLAQGEKERTEYGVLTSVGDVDAFASAIENELNQDLASTGFAERAKGRAWQFNAEAIAGQYVESMQATAVI